MDRRRGRPSEKRVPFGIVEQVTVMFRFQISPISPYPNDVDEKERSKTWLLIR
jgi:hypothetical protein